MSEKVFSPGTLWSRLTEQTRMALSCGALIPIKTRQTIIQEQGIDFIIHIATNLRRKSEDKIKRQNQSKTTGRLFNPFLPPEQELIVCAVGDNHLAVLNKFNVVDHHLLIVTREFEEQESLLNSQDFEALWQCLSEYDSLGFYNGGVVAGASQAHKHLQLIPLPLSEQTLPIPIETMIGTNIKTKNIETKVETRVQYGYQPFRSQLPYNHALAILPAEKMESASKAGQYCQRVYLELLQKINVSAVNDKQGIARQSAPYNLLMSKKWMLVVPRNNEFYRGISINAMGFAGSFFVRDEEQLNLVKQTGPVQVLQQV